MDGGVGKKVRLMTDASQAASQEVEIHDHTIDNLASVTPPQTLCGGSGENATAV